LRRVLVEKLMDVPLVGVDDNAVGRTALLAGIPNTAYFTRNSDNARGDVMMLVLQLEENFGAKGEWRLLQLVDNALPGVQGTELGMQLRQIREELLKVEEGDRPVQVHPVEMAQVHLFDLRPPVITCIALLPTIARASGFVVPTPTPRLLAYFCDSLKQRGAEYNRWSRNQVATAGGTPLVIDPRHTAVAVVLARADKVKSLLAKKHVIWPIYVDNSTDAATVWEELRKAFEKAYEHHLVITFGMPAGIDVPTGMVCLPSPKFTSQDVSNWVNDIGKVLAWREAAIERWASVILLGCADNQDDLPIEMLYERLEMHRGLITQNRTENELMNALDDLELIGE